MSNAVAMLVACATGQACDTEYKTEIVSTSLDSEGHDSPLAGLIPKSDVGITDFRPMCDDQTVVTE